MFARENGFKLYKAATFFRETSE
ncbi:uncharacterized protein METZ01_LOCUS253052 [marine metagenome]|uniref:Uncharacterized protein n=1 Tax=marine metagenome TaxID=408172 RepID=A0A382IKU5_9ZZZZ